MHVKFNFTSSHQSKVEVIGAQYPSFSGWYGIEGSHEGMLQIVWLFEESTVCLGLEPVERLIVFIGSFCGQVFSLL